MELFIEYQVPSDTSDLLSYNGHSESAALEEEPLRTEQGLGGLAVAWLGPHPP